MLLFIFAINLYLYVNRGNLRVIEGLYRSAVNYNDALRNFKDVQTKIISNKIIFEASKTSKGETYIVVIGESLNKKHMGLYGYFRDTSPLLSRENDLLVFENAYSNHTHSTPVFSLSLTEANQYNNKTYYSSLSVMDILKKADFEMFWISNQVQYGVWDNLVTVVAQKADHVQFFNKNVGRTTESQKFDSVVLKAIEDILAQNTERNRVIFVHLMGNHSDYCSRFPKTYERFQGKLSKNLYGALSDKNRHKKINCYDNSVLYNDYVVSEILRSVKKKKGTAGFIYFVDHADDVFSNLGHNSDRFSYSMTAIPFLAWFSKGYQRQYPNRYQTFEDNQNMIFSNDLFYNTLIGLFDIQTDRYNRSYDLSSSHYNLREKQALVLHGKSQYYHPKNVEYIQKKNVQNLIDLKLSTRVIPHRVNSVGKLSDIWKDGFRVLELDALYNVNKKCLEIGHDAKVMSGMCLEQFITRSQGKEITKLWIDLKNLNRDNYRAVLNALVNIEKEIKLKDELIIESTTTMDEFKVFAQAGYYTSYYLPTRKIIDLLKKKEYKAMQNLAWSIAEQSRRQQVKAVSFDYRLYPFVKDHLEPLLPDTVLYHTWDLSIKLKQTDFLTKIQSRKYYKDGRVKTIFVPYQSLFTL